VPKEARFLVDKWDSQIIIKLSRLVVNRFRWKPGGQTGLGKKVSDLGAQDADEIVDLSLDRGFIIIFGIFRSDMEYWYAANGGGPGWFGCVNNISHVRGVACGCGTAHRVDEHEP